MEPVDDSEAVRLALAGDPRGAEVIVARYQMDVYNTSLRILGNAADAEDAAQDVFVRALTRLDQYRPNQPLGAWLHGIARNRCIDMLRRRRPLAELDPGAAVATGGEDVEQVALASIERETLLAALDRLPSRQRALLVLRYWEDQPVEAVARALGMTEGAAKVALLRARRNLAALIALLEVGDGARV
jgi:RNA polymerase sigma-70 factor (ECF subfamily)